MKQNTIVSLDYNKYNTEQNGKLEIFSQDQSDSLAHSHDFLELAYVVEGSADHIINNEVKHVEKGNYFVIDYRTVHRYINCRNMSLLNCLFLPELIDDALRDCRSFEILLSMCLIRYRKQHFAQEVANRIFSDGDGSVLTLLLGINEEYQKKEIGYLEVFRCRLLEIMVITMRKVIQEQEKYKLCSHTQSQMILDAITYLEKNYLAKGVLKKFCQEYHYSQQYFSKKFKSETGIAPLDYLQRIRMNKCCELLASGDLQIQEIARAVGYEDIKYFHTLFRKLFQMSPTEYRKCAGLKSIQNPHNSDEVFIK